MDKEGRTEKATPKRRSDSRKEGQVAKSSEINSAVIILTIFISLRLFGRGIVEGLSDLMRYFLQSPASFELNEKIVSSLFLNLSIFFLKMVLPLTLVAVTVGVIANIVQVGFNYTTKPLKPNLKKINPISGMKRLFSPKSLVELLKSSIKIAIVGYIAYSIVKNRYSDIIHTIDMDMWNMMAVLGSIAYEIGIKIGITLLIIALFDYAYQRHSFEKSIKMTKQEVKEEHKQMEGDPKVKGRIRRKQMEMAIKRMMQAVPTADVIITNPVRLAIALKYDVEIMGAPKVVAKGQRLVAERIRNIANEHNVPIVEDKFLAQSLYKSVEVDREIPYDLYKAVAEILAYVYQLNKKGARVPRP